ncbi:hypothetical protein BDBG_18109, partial [Blastomyces gilchristii SLH14081]
SCRNILIIINQLNAILTDISLFFLIYSYHMKVLNLLEITQFISNLYSSIQIADNIVIKLQDI